jgi:hypothetical protein
MALANKAKVPHWQGPCGKMRHKTFDLIFFTNQVRIGLPLGVPPA